MRRDVLLPVALSLTAACGQHGGKSRVEPRDGGADASVEDAGTGPVVTGNRPSFERPGQVVPLLYGRMVIAEQVVDGRGRPQTIPLDDLSHPAAHTFFSALDAACQTELADLLERPGESARSSDCGAGGAYRLHEALCRGKAARAFAAEDTHAGLVEGAGGFRLDSDGSMPGTQAWRVRSENAHARASWALLATHELRRVVSIAASTFDARVCSGSLAREVKSGASLAQVAADALTEAHDLLPAVTREADALLRDRLVERALELEPLDPTERAQLTGDLTDSLLERMKLHAAVPYAAFIPVADEEPAPAAAYDRYPVAPGTAPARTAEAVVMLAALGTEVLNTSGYELAGSTLVDAWFASLRDAQPAGFGALPEAAAERALSHFGLSGADLERGASWLVQALRSTGAPVARRALARGSWHTLRGLRYLDAPGPAAYPYALTEARATLDLTPAEYALRGDEHALELAARVAHMATEREDAAAAHALLADLAAAAGPRVPARICVEKSEAGLSAEIEIRAAPGVDLHASSYALYRGEDAAACATQREVAGLPCATPASSPAATFDEAGRSLHFQVGAAEPGSDRFYLVDQAEEPAIVAAISLAPLDGADERRCFEVPLSAQLHRSLQAIHRDDLEALARVPALPEGRATLTLGPGLTVPTLWGQQVSVHAGGETMQLALGQPLDAGYLRVERAILAHCPAQLWSHGARRPGSCNLADYEPVDVASCLAQTLSEAASNGFALGDVRIRADNDDERLALTLWAFEARKRELVLVTRALETFACDASDLEEQEKQATEAIEHELWQRAETALSDLSARYQSLRDSMPGLWEDRFADYEPPARTVLEARALQASKLAAARLLLAIPFELYEPTDEVDALEPLGHALERFPVVTHPARYAEDTRAEELLRRTELHPLVPGSTISADGLDMTQLGAVYAGDALALSLRTRLLVEQPDTYATAPSDGDGFLAFLGISRTQLATAAARIVQLGEARGTGALVARGPDQPVRALAARATSPAPLPAHLYALTEGRAAFSPEAWPTSFGTRGFFHAAADAARALGARADLARSWTSQTRAQRLSTIEHFEGIASAASVDFSLSTTADDRLAIALELAPPEPIANREALERFELWWTDAGLACALAGNVAGSECHEQDFRLDTQAVTSDAGTLLGKPRLQLRGFRLPTPASWSPALSLAHRRARIYLTDRRSGTRTVVAGIALSEQLLEGRHIRVPVSAGLDQGLVELLAYRAPGEGCRNCVPASICETTRCELGVCLRAPAAETRTCGHAGTCTGGACSVPGCGDGTRTDGSSGVPFEACDDGNLQAGDGCTASCTVEQRALEPLIEEAYPAGPAPAVGVDGLGRSLIVYTADALSGETVSIRCARFDAFGVKQGTATTLAADIPRGYRSEPSVTGLRDGGFVVVTADPRLPQNGIALRIIDAEGRPGAPRAVDPSGAIQTEPRVAAQDDGFVVVWAERDARNLASRIRLRRFDAHGDPFGPSASVAPPATATAEQHQPAVASSLDQALVVWSERGSSDGQSLGIRAQRFSPLGYAVEAAAVSVAERGEQPSLTALQTDDYLIAWTEWSGPGAADVFTRVLRRFGPALQASTTRPLAGTELPEQRPVVAAATGEDALVIYQRGAPRTSSVLSAPSIDRSALEAAQTALSSSTDGDVSAARTARGIWLVWSARAAQRRSLYALLLPFDAATRALD